MWVQGRSSQVVVQPGVPRYARPQNWPVPRRLEQVLGSLTEKQQQLVQTLEVIRIEQMIPSRLRMPGRPRKDRAAVARAFVTKAVYDMPTTRLLLDRLATDVVLRRICGWERRREMPSESVFSRAFAEFAHSKLPQRVHEALLRKTHGDRLVGHLSRDLDGHRGAREAGREGRSRLRRPSASGGGRRRVKNGPRHANASTGNRA